MLALRSGTKIDTPPTLPYTGQVTQKNAVKDYGETSKFFVRLTAQGGEPLLAMFHEAHAGAFDVGDWVSFDCKTSKGGDGTVWHGVRKDDKVLLLGKTDFHKTLLDIEILYLGWPKDRDSGIRSSTGLTKDGWTVEIPVEVMEAFLAGGENEINLGQQPTGPIGPGHYALLGLSVYTDGAGVKSAYRRLARQFHPDLNDREDAADRFHEIQKAYDLLSGPGRRAYDNILKLGGQFDNAKDQGELSAADLSVKQHGDDPMLPNRCGKLSALVEVRGDKSFVLEIQGWGVFQRRTRIEVPVKNLEYHDGGIQVPVHLFTSKKLHWLNSVEVLDADLPFLSVRRLNHKRHRVLVGTVSGTLVEDKVARWEDDGFGAGKAGSRWVPESIEGLTFSPDALRSIQEQLARMKK